MARILVAGSSASLAARQAVAGLVERLRADGHDADTLPAARTLEALEDADAIAAFLDGPVPDAGAAALLGYAHALGKPTLGLRHGPLPPALASLLTLDRELRGEADLDAVLPAFYDRVRPFAGRLVRDQVPDLVRAAGHDVRFRELAAEELPAFLKRRIAEAGRDLQAAGPADESEEVADLLEALEAFLKARHADREELRRVKEAKRKRRGGFERGFVVESALPGSPSVAPAAPADAPPATSTAEPERAEPLLRDV